LLENFSIADQALADPGYGLARLMVNHNGAMVSPIEPGAIPDRDQIIIRYPRLQS
jgi:hypothetical protein